MKIQKEEDKKYLRKLNVDHHSDEVVNKTIEKDVGKHSTKSAGDNLDKSAEFIFDDDDEERLKPKILRIEEYAKGKIVSLQQDINYYKTIQYGV